MVVEDSLAVEFVEEGSGWNKAGPASYRSLEVSNARLSNFSSRIVEVPVEPLFGSLLMQISHVTDEGYSSLLSEREFKGEISSLEAHARHLMPMGCHVNARDGLVCQVDKVLFTDPVGDVAGVGFSNGPSANGPSEEQHNALGFRLDLQIVNFEAGDSGAAHTSVVDKNMGFDEAVNAPKVTTRRRKKSKKRMAQLVYGDITSTTAISDDSIADDDIEHRNAIIRNEAEATWEVSQALGIYFDCEKDKLLDVFTDLEYEERKRNMSRA